MKLRLTLDGRTIYLTDAEKAVLQHRLDVPDAIASALTDDPDDPMTDEDVGDAIEKTENGFRAGQFDLTGDESAKKVLIDVATGSTWMANADEELTPSALASARRTVTRLSGKLSTLLGEPISIPSR